MLKQLQQNIHKFNSLEKVDIPVNPTIEIKKEYRGNQHDLDTYLNTINYMEYVKNNKKNGRKTKVISHENTFSDISSLQEYFETNQYMKKWSRLDLFLKKNKIKEFLEKKVNDEVISDNKKEHYFRLLTNLLNNKKLNKKSEVVYDENNGYIVDIPIFKSLII